jgi:hypothetical protein
MGIFALCLAFPAQPADLRVTFAELTRLIQTIAGGAKVYLNNTPELLATASYAQITPTQQYPIPIPVKSFTILGSTYSYFVSDVSSTSVRVVPVTGALRLAMTFESEGPEAVVRCLSGSCSLENALPDIQWDNATVNVDFVPIRFGDSISLQVKSVSLGGNAVAVCKVTAGVVSGTACRLGRPFANRTITGLKNDLPKILKDQINQPGLQQQFAEGLKRYLSLGQAGEVMVSSISVEPRSMTVNFRLPGGGSTGN